MNNTTSSSQNQEDLLLKLLSNIKSSLTKVENKNLYNYYYLDCIAQNQRTLELPVEFSELERKFINTFEILGSLHLSPTELLNIENDDIFIQKIRQRDTINKLIVYLLKDIESNIILEQKLLNILQKLNSTATQTEILEYLRLQNIPTDRAITYIEYGKSEIEQLIYILKYEENSDQTFYYYINELNKIAYKLFSQKESRYKYIYNFVSDIALQQDQDGFNNIQDQLSLVDSKYFSQQEIENKIVKISLPKEDIKLEIQNLFDKYIKLLSLGKFKDLLFLIGSFDSKELIDLINLATLIKGEDNQLINYKKKSIDIAGLPELNLKELKSITNTTIEINQRYENFFENLGMLSQTANTEQQNLITGVSQILCMLIINFEIEFIEAGSEGALILDFVRELKNKDLIFLLEEAYAGNFDESIPEVDVANTAELTARIFLRIHNKKQSNLDNLKLLESFDLNKFDQLVKIRLQKLLKITLREGHSFVKVDKDSQGVISRIFLMYQQMNPSGLTEEMAEILIYINEQSNEAIQKQLSIIFDFCVSKYQTVVKEIGSKLSTNRFTRAGITGTENDSEAILKYESLQQTISQLRLVGLKVQFYNDLQYTASINTKLLNSYLEGYSVIDI